MSSKQDHWSKLAPPFSAREYFTCALPRPGGADINGEYPDEHETIENGRWVKHRRGRVIEVGPPALKTD